MNSVQPNGSRSHSAEDPALSHFHTIPWCRQHFLNPRYQLLDIPRAGPVKNDGTMWEETLKTERTVLYLLNLYQPPSANTSTRGELLRFHSLGSGMNGHPNLLHGGAVATILDAALGNLIRLELSKMSPSYTAYINVGFKKPIATPGTILSRSWVSKVEGRKIFATAQIEDSENRVCATAEGLFIGQLARL